LKLEEVYLVIPSMQQEQSYNEMIAEQEKTHPGAIKNRGMDYASWLMDLEKYKNYETCPADLVPSDTFFLINKHNKIIGVITIRHYLNEQFSKVGGHIGYGVRPSERRKGYAKIMLKMALEKCRNMGMRQILITCDKDNIASSKTIIANGGIFENEFIEDNGNVVQRYWVQIHIHRNI
jgi:predicted acetyltransferase